MSPQEQLALLKRASAEIISEQDLLARIESCQKEKRPMRIKLGLDPTAPHIHLGFAVVLRKLRQFQDLGHQVVLLIGDFTARVGDPTGRSETRKVLTTEEIESNAATYREQLSRILDPEKTEVRFNSEWLAPLNFADILGLASKYTVAQLLEREDFTKRYKGGIPIGMHELLYPLMQGYDSVALRSDVEMGGTDQKFNNLVGRFLQREYGQPSQVVFLMPILEGLDGVKKMSKSLGNYVGITEAPEEMFGKLMSIPDSLMRRYFELCTEVDLAEVDRRLAQDHPRDNKFWLGREIITIYHGASAAQAAQDEFVKVFSNKENPTDMPSFLVTREAAPEGKVGLAKLLLLAEMAPSNKEGRRLIEQGAVQWNGVKVTDPGELSLAGGGVLKVGRRFVRIELE
ncbi:MAG: tyrosine--tRNA ligase [Candidatus Eremiobacteraeota bacterium]|nr:tyrosine--tRNA ligase [Candidatus Eremiobacteraeota bacterium]